ITREQLAAILCRYAAFRGEDVSLDPDTNFLSWNDVRDISGWAKDSLFWCIQEGLVNGKGNGNLDPQGTATRAQVAQILMKYLGK
ncbi:MAG: S-layer homology domain-containing protein, partial [Ruminiclostridium sp.]|nr:S-layer homology domain-containing protein [Ruminiclostridium sp.]